MEKLLIVGLVKVNMFLVKALADAKGITVAELLMIPVNTVVDTVKNISNKAISAVKTTVTNTVAKIKGFAHKVIDSVKTTVTNTVDTVIATKDKVVETTVETIDRTKTAVVNKATEVKDTVVDKICETEEELVKRTSLYKAMQENNAALLERLSALESMINNANNHSEASTVNHIVIDSVDND